jgi:hypothetical protein
LFAPYLKNGPKSKGRPKGSGLKPPSASPFVDPRLPKDFALLVRIQRVNDAGFLPMTKARCPLRKPTKIGD